MVREHDEVAPSTAAYEAPGRRLLAPIDPGSRAGAMAQQRAVGNRAVCQALRIQAKLVVGDADDPLEREADVLARHALQATDGAPRPFRRWAPAALDPIDPGLERAIAQTRGGGRPIPDADRRPVERALAVDLRGVRLHDDAVADRLTRSLTARAFTCGPDIFVRPGEYLRGGAGSELIAHELVHVAQQGAASPYRPHAAPARVIQRVLDEAEKKRKAQLEDEIKRLSDVIGSKGSGKGHFDAVNTAKLERGKCSIELAKLLKKEAELSPEDRKAEYEATLAAEQQRRAAEQKRAEEREAKIQANKLAFSSQIKDTLAAAAQAEAKLVTAEDEIKAVSEDSVLSTRNDVKTPLDALVSAVRAARVARGKAQDIKEDTVKAEADAFLADANAASASATTEGGNVTLGIAAVAARLDLTRQNDRFDAEYSISHGYTGGAAMQLDHTFVSNDDAKSGGFSGEYHLAAKPWCVHVHRSKAGRWQKAHVKNKGDYTTGNSADLPVSGPGNVRRALDRLGIVADDTSAGTFFKENHGPYHNGPQAQPALNAYLK